MNKKIKIAIIGSGKLGQRHAKIYSSFPNVDVVAICDTNKKLAQHCASKFSCKEFTSSETLLKNIDFDAASICTPNGIHLEPSIDLIKQGKHILVEKPLATTITDCKKIISQSKKQGIVLMTGHTHRFYPCNVKLKKIIKSGGLGAVKIITDYSLLPYKIDASSSKIGKWNFQKSIGGGIIFDSVHFIDRIRWWFDTEFDYVNSLAMGKIRNNSKTEEYCFITFRLKNGIIGSLLPIGPSLGSYDANVSIVGTMGNLSMKFGEEIRLGTKKWKNIDFKGKSSPQSREHIMMGFRSEIKEFIDSIKQKREPSVTGEDGLKSIKVVQAIFDSYKKKRKITL